MPFHFRKSISVGPFRFNLSKSGIGVSAGVKGMRIGTGPGGSYVHVGGGSVYYRTSLGNGPRQPRPSIPNRPASPSQPVDPQSGIFHVEQVETGNLLEMSPGHVSDIVQQITEKAHTSSRWPGVAALGSAASVMLTTLKDQIELHLSFSPLLITLAGLLLTAIITLRIHRGDQIRRTLVIMYDLEDDAQDKYGTFVEEFDKLAACNTKWNIETNSLTTDWKRNSGATNLIKRGPANFSYGTPRTVKTNIDAPRIIGGTHTLYFFPDVMLVERGNSYGAVPYEDLQISVDTTNFIESDQAPWDAKIVGQTWKYTNKNGGPDRRFNDNVQIPIAEYQVILLTAPGEFRKMFHISKIDDRRPFRNAVDALAAREVDEVPGLNERQIA